MNRFKKWILKKLTEREIKAVLDGKEGPMLKQITEWVLTHRVLLGGIFGSISVGLLNFPDPRAHQFGGYAGLISAYLLGAGHTDSDATKKEEILDKKVIEANR